MDNLRKLLEELVLPRFDSLEQKLAEIEEDIASIKQGIATEQNDALPEDEVSSLKTSIYNLEVKQHNSTLTRSEELTIPKSKKSGKDVQLDIPLTIAKLAFTADAQLPDGSINDWTSSLSKQLLIDLEEDEYWSEDDDDDENDEDKEFSERDKQRRLRLARALGVSPIQLSFARMEH